MLSPPGIPSRGYFRGEIPLAPITPKGDILSDPAPRAAGTIVPPEGRLAIF
jgi:hypothetical protein